MCIPVEVSHELCSDVGILFLGAMATERTLTEVQNGNDDYLSSKSISAKSVCIPDGAGAYTTVELICRRVLNTLFQQTLQEVGNSPGQNADGLT